VFRTDADPRTVDLSLDPNERPYGSVFGQRPELIDYGLVGFGRLTTPEAWLSTWSGLASRAIAKGEPTGNELAAAEISGWLAKRHELTPPG
jgi:hypothetical protein